MQALYLILLITLKYEINSDRKTCKMLEGIVTLPLEPTVTGAISQTCCNRFLQTTGG